MRNKVTVEGNLFGTDVNKQRRAKKLTSFVATHGISCNAELGTRRRPYYVQRDNKITQYCYL